VQRSTFDAELSMVAPWGGGPSVGTFEGDASDLRDLEAFTARGARATSRGTVIPASTVVSMLDASDGVGGAPNQRGFDDDPYLDLDLDSTDGTGGDIDVDSSNWGPSVPYGTFPGVDRGDVVYEGTSVPDTSGVGDQPNCAQDFCASENDKDYRACSDEFAQVAANYPPYSCIMYFADAWCMVGGNGCKYQDPNYPSYCDVSCTGGDLSFDYWGLTGSELGDALLDLLDKPGGGEPPPEDGLDPDTDVDPISPLEVDVDFDLTVDPSLVDQMAGWVCDGKCYCTNGRTTIGPYHRGTGRGATETDACNAAKDACTDDCPTGWWGKHEACLNCKRRA
jgi:hypothetical protein